MMKKKVYMHVEVYTIEGMKIQEEESVSYLI